MKKKLSLLLAIVLCLTLFVPATAVTSHAAGASIKLNKSVLTLASNKKYTLKATVTGKSKTVTWKSSNPKVASVSKSGVVKPVNVGRVVITASANGKKAKCIVTIYPSTLRLSDFSAESNVNRITLGSPYMDVYTYLSAGSYNAYYDFYEHHASQYNVPKSKVVKTLRGITLGSSKKDVKAAYGDAQQEKFDKNTDKIYQIQSQSFGKEYFNGTKTLKNAKSVLVYNYSKNGSYDIRFYFNKNDRLISVVYTKNYSSFSGFGNWSHY